jgi:hypothetical protein
MTDRSEPRLCACCCVSEEFETLAFRGDSLVCAGCNEDLEREWVDEAPREHRHYLDTFRPA